MLTTASQFTPRARFLHTRHVPTARALGVGCAHGIRERQQTRSFRWRIWSKLDEDYSQEIRRRKHMAMHKYLEQMNRRTSWENHPFVEDSRHTLKRIMKSYWHSSYPGGRPLDDVEPPKHESPDRKGDVRPGQNIEDVERGAMEHLIYGKDEVPSSTYPYKHLSNSQRRRARKLSSNAHPNYDQPIEHEDDFIIDPITNRKVPKTSPPSSLEHGIDIPVKTFKDYRSQFANPDTSKQNISSRQRGLYSQSSPPITPAAEKAASSSEQGARSDSSLRYPPFQDSGLDGNLASSVEALSTSHGDPPMHRTAVEEAHGQFGDLQPPQETVDEYGYESMVADEIAGRLEDAEPRDLNQSSLTTSETAAMSNAEPARHGHESDQHGSVWEGEPLDSKEEFVKPEVLRHYQNSVYNMQPGDFSESNVEDLRAKYGAAELKQYTAERHFEQDEKSYLTAEQVRQQYDHLGKHDDPSTLNESPGTLQATRERLREQYNPEVAKYDSYDCGEPKGEPKQSLEGQTKVPEYDGPVLVNESDGRLPLSEQIASSENNEAKTEDYDDGSLTWTESEGKPSPHQEDLSHLETRNGPLETTKQEPDGRPFAQIEQIQNGIDARNEDAGDQRVEPKNDYKDFVAGYEALERLTSVRQGHGRKSSIPQLSAFGKLEDGVVSSSEAMDEPARLRPSLDRLASVKQGQGKLPKYREMLETLMNQHEQMSNAHDEEASMAIKSAKSKTRQSHLPKRKFTGNYVRDFPEEFEKSWTQTLASIPTEESTTYESEVPTERGDMDGGLEGAFGQPSPTEIQPALSRSRQAAVDRDDQHPKDFQIPGTSHHHESGEEIKQTGSASSAKDEVATATEKQNATTAPDEAENQAAEKSNDSFEDSTSPKEPILYRILAYDPTMQKINMAETTSLVPDFAAALSPADALLRLSHPTRFFPHFASLEAEGFEIVSGSGDVLVFRKVRPSKPEQVEEAPSESSAAAAAEPSEPPSTEPSINPIDMTGRPRVVSPASANFASPTGYVKYESLPETEASNLPPPPPPPRVAYNINLRREEPVYSGPKARTYGAQKQKKSLGKRLLVGGVWVAGISYGLGVVSEYFTTGGVDGLGPQGL